MDSSRLVDNLLMYLGLVVLLTFHEFGHAWMALRCGDDTAQQHGRVSLNPLVHIDPIGTVVVPLLMFFMSSWFLIGWAKPVPVNPYNLRNPKVDDILVSLAGPWMNVLLAVVLIGLGRVFWSLHLFSAVELSLRVAQLSLLLCFFNLIPIPPLDGSQVARSLLNISHEAYHQVAQFGFLILIVALQFPLLQNALSAVTFSSFRIISGWFGLHFA